MNMLHGDVLISRLTRASLCSSLIVTVLSHSKTILIYFWQIVTREYSHIPLLNLRTPPLWKKKSNFLPFRKEIPVSPWKLHNRVYSKINSQILIRRNWKCTENLMCKWHIKCIVVLSLPEPKARVSFSDQNLSVVRRCRWRCRKLFTFSSSSLEQLDQFQPNLSQSILGWKGFQMEGPAFFLREIHVITK